MASRGSITIEVFVKGYPPNAPDCTYQESMIIDVPNGDDTESHFRKVTAVMRNVWPSPAIALGLRDAQFDPERKLWTGTVGDGSVPPVAGVEGASFDPGDPQG